MKNKKLTCSHWSRDNIITGVSTVASRNVEETCQSNFNRVAGRLSTVNCECGAEILFIHDVKEMGRVIECHAEEHRKREQNPVEGEAAFERVENFLLKQVLGRAAFEGGWKE